MKALRLLAAIALLALPLARPASAQIAYAQTVSACGTPNNTPVTGNTYPLTMDSTGKLCDTGGGSSSSTVVTQPTASLLNATVVGSGPVTPGTAQAGSALGGCINNTTLPTLTDAQQAALHCGTRGSLLVTVVGSNSVTPANITGASADSVSNGTAGMTTYGFNSVFNGTSWDRQRSISGTFGSATGVTSVEQSGASFSDIATATTTTVKSGAGILHKIVVNTYVASATITVYDNTAASGTKIATITLPSTITGDSPDSIVYDLSFATGLTVVTSGATDITVVYR